MGRLGRYFFSSIRSDSWSTAPTKPPLPKIMGDVVTF
jgi:hypothetical protein